MVVSNKIISIIGKPGCGKSYLTNRLIEKDINRNERGGIVILDFQGEYLNFVKKGFKYLKVDPSIFRHYYLNWVGILEKYPYIIIEPFGLTIEEYQKLGNQIASAIIKVEQRSFYLEEAHLCFPVHSSLMQGFGELVTTGRKLGIDFIFVCQRSSTINTTAIATANLRICFQQDEPNDIKKMQSYFSQYKIDELKRFEFVAKNTMTHQTIKGNTSNCDIIDQIW